MRRTHPVGDQAREQESRGQEGGHNRQRKCLDHSDRSTTEEWKLASMLLGTSGRAWSGGQVMGNWRNNGVTAGQVEVV